MRKIIKALMCIILIPCLILTACGDKKKSAPKDPEYAVTAPFIEESQRIRLEKPAEGWTGEELIKTLYINGNPIPEPYTLEAMGEEYSVKLDEPDTQSNDIRFLQYKGVTISEIAVRFKNDLTQDNLYTNPITGIVVEAKDTTSCEEVDFNGVSLGSTREEAIKAFGEPEYIHKKSRVSYKGFSFFLNDEGKVKCFVLIINNGKLRKPTFSIKTN